MVGVVCAGHWVIDSIKFIDNWPNRSGICTIQGDSISNGGGPFNILVDLKNLAIDIPTFAIGCIGDDRRGQLVQSICRENNIAQDFLYVLEGEQTSYTDVMALKHTGERTMFHFHGANDRFSIEHVPMEKIRAKNFRLFYLGHLLLMKALEEKDETYELQAARLLHHAQIAGMETIIDIVTVRDLKRYETVVQPCLPYVDHLIIGELEAERLSGFSIRTHGQLSMQAVQRSAERLMASVKKNVILHMPEGAYWLNAHRESFWRPAFDIPSDQIESACSAGDAFCAGAMVGLHEKWSKERTLELAHAMAAMVMKHWHNSKGIQPLSKTLELARRFPLQSSEYFLNN